jgi:hypothetical protein
MIKNLHIFRHGCWVPAVWPLHVAHNPRLFIGVPEIIQNTVELDHNIVSTILILGVCCKSKNSIIALHRMTLLQSFCIM